MLYPIELLRHKPVATRRTACMLTARPRFVMSSVGLFKCRQAPCNAAGSFTVHFALPQKAIIAECNPTLWKNPAKRLFLKDLTAVRLLARRLLCLFNRRTIGAPSHEQHSLACKRNCIDGFGGFPLCPRAGRTGRPAHAALLAGAEGATVGGVERAELRAASGQRTSADTVSARFRTSGF